jgi:hypothetical protein
MSTNKFELKFTIKASSQLDELIESSDKKSICKAVHKALGYMEIDLKHQSLKTHEYSREKGKNGEKVFESYAQNNTPGAYRFFWHYGPGKNIITILAITPHP